MPTGIQMLLLALLSSVVHAGEIFFDEVVDGGVSIDASGVSTNYGVDTWNNGDDLGVVIPAGATVDRIFAVVHPKNQGFEGDPADFVQVNGRPLSQADHITTGDADAYRVYELDPVVFDIEEAGSFAYRENGLGEVGNKSGTGISGTTLAVVYRNDASRTGRRHVVLGADRMFDEKITLEDLPTSGTTGEMVLSVGISWECSDEQSGRILVNGDLVTEHAGGRDDGAEYDTACGNQDNNSLITQGSFGFGTVREVTVDGSQGAVISRDLWYGFDRDHLEAEPGNGTAQNSRLSDELWLLPYDESGTVGIEFDSPDADAWFGAFALAIELDSDGDGLRDADDNCRDVANADQADLDGDGLGNPCDPDADDDGDTSTAFGGLDCDDLDPDVYYGAPEVWYDGVIQDCSSASDFDQDRDGFDSSAHGGEDCDDLDEDINPDAEEIPGDEIDQNCDGVDTCDVDGDGYDMPSCGGDDCDDDDDTVYPGAPELPDGIDNNCNGYLEGVDTDADGISDEDELRIGSDPEERDTDGDGLHDGREVGSLNNPRDTDGDGTPDFADDDDDDDGIPTAVEVGPGFDPNDPQDEPLDTDSDGQPDYRDLDSDGDRFSDAREGNVDTDGDGTPDYRDLDSDDDTVPDIDERDADTDGDGLPDRIDDDDDDDGLLTEREEEWPERDVDGDGVWNFLDDDSDSDGKRDEDELDGDVDGDGIPNFVDPDDDDGPLRRPSFIFTGGSCSTTPPPSTFGGLALVALLGLRRRRSERP